MAKNEFAAVIANIEALQRRMERAPDDIARRCLDFTLNVVPRPPWNTGQLRNSGVAYVGGRSVAHTKDMVGAPKGINPNGWMAKGRGTGKGGGTISSPTRTNINKFKSGESDGAIPASVLGTISIVYNSPIAALMHEWPGKFTDAQSGKHYITAKFTLFRGAFALVLKKVWT